MAEWNDLSVATAGASAALSGLIFVGISINMKTILEYTSLVGRAFVSLILLLCILTVSILLLVPQTTVSMLGLEILIIGTLVWLVVTARDIKSYKQTLPEYKHSYMLAIVTDQFALLPYIVSGLVILFSGEHGIYWIVPSFILSFVKSLSDAWVLLIEVNR